MKQAFIFILAILISGCGPIWESGEYEIYYIDGYVSLGIKIDNQGTYHGRVDHKVVSAAANENYVVAKRIANGNGEIEFYYIDKRKDNPYLNADEITQGPFTEAQFLKISKELGLPKLKDRG